jgi:hypothetical protein
MTQPLTEKSIGNVVLGDKGGRSVVLATLPPLCADCIEILRTSGFTFIIIISISISSSSISSSSSSSSGSTIAEVTPVILILAQ